MMNSNESLKKQQINSKTVEADNIRIEAYPIGNPMSNGIKITHIPTGKEFIATKHRHQYLNKDDAIKALFDYLSERI